MLTRLLKNSRVIFNDSHSAVVQAITFSQAYLKRLHEFRFKETPTQYVLRDDLTKRVQYFDKTPAEEQEGTEEEDDEDDERGEFDNYGAREGVRAYPNRPASYETWDNFQRTIYDHQHQHFEQQSLSIERIERRQQEMANELAEMREQQNHALERQARNEETTQMIAYYQQRYHHDDYEYSEEARREHHYGYQMRQPEWWRGQQTQASSSSQPSQAPDPFDTRPLSRSLYEDIFGQRFPDQ